MTGIQGEAYYEDNDYGCSNEDLVRELSSNIQAAFMYLGIISIGVHKHEGLSA